MTFEEWFEKEGRKFISPYTLAMAAWDAAKEDSKPVAKIIERKLYGMNEVEYSVIGFDGYESAIRSTKEQAEQWCLENGYRLE